MDLSTKVEWLTKEELAHELTKLQIPFAESDSCDTLRKLFRQTRSLIRRGSLKLSIGTLSADSPSEMPTCRVAIQGLQKEVAEGTALSDARRQRLVGRVEYYLGRLHQITGQGDADEVQTLKGVLVECLSTLNPDEDSSDSEVEVFRSPRKTRTEAVCRAEPRYNLASLNLKFKGDTCVRAFVTRLDELRQAREIPERIIFNGFPDVLDGPALFWYRSNRDNFTCYTDLLKALKADFDIPDFDFRLLSEIRARTQAKHESIVVYLSIMGALFSRLTVPLAEAERLDILLRNVRPEYSRELALIDVTSIEMLKSLCKRLELAGSRAGNFTEPSSSGYTVAPDVQVQSRNNTACRKQAVGSVDKTEGTYCFRCKQAGHKTNRCQRSRELVCFGCGHPGVRTPECPRCTKGSTSKN
ncbi:uncharacterized protein [Choristoneura fumiferana]|uniref:uncharacterized protein n=1 Tax=Choristoneura fumiferana TaxID=7141 RepID=UPI003D15386F